MNQLRLLEFAVALDHHRSFARGAQAMHVTQPSFSRAIATLESRLGTRLFERNNREVRPTSAGEIVLQRARRLLADHAALGDALDAQRTLHSGRVTVATGPYALEVSIIEAVVRLTRKHPRLHVEVIEGDWRRLGELMLARGIELAVFDTRLIATDHRFQVQALPTHRGYFYCRAEHPLAGRTGLQLREVLAYTFVGMPGPYQTLAEAAGAVAGLQIDAATGSIRPMISTTSAAAARAIVRLTDGVGLATHAQLEDQIKREGLSILDVDWSGMYSAYGLVTLREHMLSPAAEALAAMIREVEAERADPAATLPLERTAALHPAAPISMAASSRPPGVTGRATLLSSAPCPSRTSSRRSRCRPRRRSW